jgi:hypothetical protein
MPPRLIETRIKVAKSSSRMPPPRDQWEIKLLPLRSLRAAVKNTPRIPRNRSNKSQTRSSDLDGPIPSLPTKVCRSSAGTLAGKQPSSSD